VPRTLQMHPNRAKVQAFTCLARVRSFYCKRSAPVVAISSEPRDRGSTKNTAGCALDFKNRRRDRMEADPERPTRIAKSWRHPRRFIDAEDCIASPAAILEAEFLHEIGRLKPPASTLMEVLAADFGVRVCDISFRTIAEHACHEKWTRDPFDRLLVANARVTGARLLTKDDRIQRHYPHAIW
jgi:PIN domain nuclease of toxin-antitoxin system